MNKTQWVSWVAVSSKPQLERESPDEQRRNNEVTIRENDGELYVTLEVPGYSREFISFERAARELEAYAALKNLIDNRLTNPSRVQQIDMILVCRDLDRLGRTAALITQVVSYCHKAGIGIYDRSSPPATLDAAKQAKSQADVILTGVRASYAQIEMLKLRERHEYGMIGRIKRGRFAGRVPWGWHKKYREDGSHIIEVDEQAAHIIRFALLDLIYEQGLSYTATAAELNECGYRTQTGKEFSHGNVQSMIYMLPRYAGYAEINRDGPREYVIAPGNFPAILTDDEARTVRAEIDYRNEARPRQTRHEYKFARAVWCTYCDAPLRADTRRYTVRGGEERFSRRYMCRTPDCIEYHGKRNQIAERGVERALVAFCEWLTTSEGVEYHMRDGADITATQDAVNAVTEQVEALQDQRERLTKAYITLQAISDEEYQQTMEGLATQRDALAHRLDELRSRLADAEHDAGRMQRIVLNGRLARRYFDEGDVEQINLWARRNFKVYIEHGKVVRIVVL